MQQQLDFGTTFTTSRTRPAVVAVITTLLTVAMEPWHLEFGEYAAGQTFVLALAAIFLYVAVRSWRVVLRGPIELRLTSTDLTVTRRGRRLTIPWYEVADIRIDGKPNQLWVVARLSPAVNPAGVPVSRRRDGLYKLFPVAHGRPTKRSTVSRQQLRLAIMSHSRRYLSAV